MAAAISLHPASHFSPSHAASPTMIVDSVPSRGQQASPRPPPLALADESEEVADTTDLVTPTKHDFSGMAAQRPLPDAPVSTPDFERSDMDVHSVGMSTPATTAARTNDDQDVEMVDDDDDRNDEQNESDNDSTTSDSQRSRRKKKGQRFYCTDFPPCNLSFTRSEHLARHIRKHTGERPFACHCGRRFSRLDNLRQHAQTVHVNEEIPGDSLAATGTRFQRQIRTDRVRAPGSRARAGTGGSYTHARGHSRNMSSSSVASTTSNVSSLPDDARRRPPPLAMAQDPAHGRPTADAHGGPAGYQPQYAYYAHPPSSGYTTPPSATYSTGGHSPRFPVQSPTSAPRMAYFPHAPPPFARRLSVPSVPYIAAAPYPGAMYDPNQTAPPHHTPSNSTSSIASPLSPTYSHSRRESEAELELRRRTWHPGSYVAQVRGNTTRPATSGLAWQQTPDDVRPTTSGEAVSGQVTRLPGIESFDQAASTSSQPRVPSPMDLDPTGRPRFYSPNPEQRQARPTHRATQSALEPGLYHGIDRLGIGPSNSARPPVPTRHRPPLPAFSFPQAPPSTDQEPVAGTQLPSVATDPHQPKHDLYGHLSAARGTQPLNVAGRNSPQDSVSTDGVPTPSTSHSTESYPIIARSSDPADHRSARVYGTTHVPQLSQSREIGKPAPPRIDSGSHIYHYQPPQAQPASPANRTAAQPRHVGFTPSQGGSDMDRLAALVAVATSESANR